MSKGYVLIAYSCVNMTTTLNLSLDFPVIMKVKWNEVSESRSVVSDSLRPHELYSPWNSPGQYTGVGSLFPSPGDLPDPGIKLGSPAFQADSLPSELREAHYEGIVVK